jgi:hypothetical protein
MRQIIDTTKLDQWFNSKKRRAQELLPHLIHNLIRETVKHEEIISLRIPVVDQINMPGYDGTMEAICEHHQFVPKGLSVWEMGTGDPKKKANEDYSDREGDTNKTIIFINPHPFAVKDDWIKDKTKDGKWKEIRFYDGIDIASWLEMAPNTARWLAKEMGLPVEGWYSTEDYLSEELHARYAVKISPELIIGGRQESVDKLHGWLEKDILEIRIVGESLEEAAAFIAASFCVMPKDTREIYEPRVTLINNSEGLEYFTLIMQKHYIVPLTVETRIKARALEYDNIKRIVPETREVFAGKPSSSNVPTILLGTMQREAIEEHLQKLNITPEKIGRIARESKGSLTALIWMIAEELNNPPKWISAENAIDLVPLLLAGQWIPGNEGDREAIVTLSASDSTYGNMERAIAKWRTPNGPLIQRGSSWDWLAGDFAWDRLSEYIDKNHLDRFCSVVNKVLGTTDPTIKLDANQRWAAPMYNVEHPYSEVLRKGLVESVCQIALHDDKISDGNGQQFANSIVNSLLSGEKQSLRESWFSLAHWLPDIAEAAPEEFLRCIEKFIQDKDAVKIMFEEGDSITISSLHTYILWALERMAWNESYLPRVTIALGDLASVDPGGSLRNRPTNSLLEIYMPWHVQTTASAENRLRAIDALHEKHPDCAWDLCKALLPDNHSMVGQTDEPKWRDWKPKNYKASVSVGGYWDFIEELIDRLLKWAEPSGKYWSDLIESYTTIRNKHPELAERMLSAFKTLGTIITNDDDRSTLSNTLRKILTLHRNYPDSEWSMESEDLEQFESIHCDLLPTSLQKQYAWLFDSWPELPKEDDMSYEKGYENLQNRRKEAVDKIMAVDKYEGLLKFATIVERPDEVGYALGGLSIESSLETKLLKTTLGILSENKDDTALTQFGTGYARSRYCLSGDEWLMTVLANKEVEWNAIKYANLALALPKTKQIWNRLCEWGNEAEKLYWTKWNIHGIVDDDVKEAINKLLIYERPYAALYLAGHYVRTARKTEKQSVPLIPDDTLIRLLEETAKHDPQKESGYASNLSYCIEEILNVLESHDLQESKLAKLEWMWLPVLEHGKRGLKTLQKGLASNPSLFIDVLKMIYRSDNEEKQEFTENQKLQGSQAYRLLSAWKYVPGQVEYGETEKKSDSHIHFAPGKIDKESLFEWVANVHRLAKGCGRLGVCDSHIGQVLAYAPTKEDGTWPCIPVRELIEQEKNEEIEKGIVIGVYNKRGVYSQGKGGEYEYEIADQFKGFADNVRSRWPRTGALLDRISKHYKQSAKWEDERDAISEFD